MWLFVIPLYGCQASENNDEVINKTINLVDSGLGLRIGHQVLDNHSGILVIYAQSKVEFCADKSTLRYTPSLEIEPKIAWRDDRALEIQTNKISISEFYGTSRQAPDLLNSNLYQKFEDRSGSVAIDISEYYQNKAELKRRGLIVDYGYIAIDIFPCSQLFDNGDDPKVDHIRYNIRLR